MTVTIHHIHPRSLRIALAVVIAGLLYCRSLGNGFLMLWDDQWMVFNSYTADGLTPGNISRIATEFYHGQFSPLNQFVYTLLYHIAGYNPVVYHGFCILMHLLNVVAAYLFLDALFNAMSENLYPAAPEGRRSSVTANAAFIGTLLFAVHPVNVETVSWVSASKIVLCSFFYILGLYLYITFIRNHSRIIYIAVLLLFIFAFGAKEQAVSFVLCCLIIDYAVKRKESLPDTFLEKLPMILLALFFGVLTMMTHWHSGSARMPVYSGFQDRIVLASYSMCEYIITTILPCSLSYIYPFPYQPGESIPLYVRTYPALLIFMVYLISLFRKNRLVMFASLFFWVNLVLMLHIIPMSRFTVTCDRYLYMALLGPAALAGWWAAYGLTKRPLLTLSILIPYILYLSAYTFTYQSHWVDSSSLKREMRQLLHERNSRYYPPTTGKSRSAAHTVIYGERIVTTLARSRQK